MAISLFKTFDPSPRDKPLRVSWLNTLKTAQRDWDNKAPMINALQMTKRDYDNRATHDKYVERDYCKDPTLHFKRYNPWLALHITKDPEYAGISITMAQLMKWKPLATGATQKPPETQRKNEWMSPWVTRDTARRCTSIRRQSVRCYLDKSIVKSIDRVSATSSFSTPFT